MTRSIYESFDSKLWFLESCTRMVLEVGTHLVVARREVAYIVLVLKSTSGDNLRTTIS